MGLQDDEMTLMKKKIISCQIFKDELSAALPEEFRDIDITWLDVRYHWNLDALEKNLKQVLQDAAAEKVDARVLYGRKCHPAMCQIINSHGRQTLGARNCIHAFCGDYLDELQQDRTMVITPGWIRYFPAMMEEAGWGEVDVRLNLGGYDRILVLETGVNPLSDEEIMEFYDLTQVPIEMQQISLDYFRTKLLEVLT